MILERWPDLPPIAKGGFIIFSVVLAVGGGLTLSTFVLAKGMKIPLDLPADALLWLKAAFAGYTDENTIRWIKISGLVGLAPALLIGLAILKNKPKADVHGKAKFASERNIKAADLRADTGLIAGFTGRLPSRNYGYPVNKLGQASKSGSIRIAGNGNLNHKNLLMYGGDEHMFLYAPTRSGKGVAIVVPNLLNWSESAVVLDVKKENWMLTSGFRKKGGQDVYLFDPLDPDGKTHRWNPLSTVRRNTEFQVEDLQRLADLFIPVQSKDPFFDRAAQTAFVGVAGYLAETPDLPFTMGEIYRQLTLAENAATRFAGIIKRRKAEKRNLSPQTLSALNDFISKSDNTFESVKSTITANLGLFANPQLDRATAESDFQFSDLRKRPMSIYVGVSPNNLGRLAPLLNLFFQSLVDANMQQLPEHNPDLKYKVLLCMDEFTAIGELPSFKRGIGYFAGYGLKVLTVIQTPAQLRDIYGVDGADAYMDNAGIEVIFTPKNLKEAKNISERLGTHAVESNSTSSPKHLSNSRGTTVNTSDQRRSLLLPQELLAMPKTDALVLIAGEPPIKARRIRFYAEQVFLDRSNIPPPDIPSINKPVSDQALRNAMADLQSENTAMRSDLASLRDEVERIRLLGAFQQANVANGDPSEVDMTPEEIANPDTISADRLALADTKARAKVAELIESNRLTSKEGTHELLSTLLER